jgi:DnaK suppressor protein
MSVDPTPSPDPAESAPLATVLSRIEHDLAEVEVALARLDAGTYWTCERTGLVLPDGLLAERPTARQLP